MASFPIVFVAALALALGGIAPLSAQDTPPPGSELPPGAGPDLPPGTAPATPPSSPAPADPAPPGEAPQDQDAMAALYARLADPANPEWELAESDVQREWSKSGSPAMDLLLKRGRDAMEAGDLAAAVDHLTALTDHAPDFAEGWNARATAFFLQGRIGQSMADIKRTLALNPHHYAALAGLGMILEQMGQRDAALKAYRASLAIHPHQKDVAQSVTRLETADQGVAL